MDQNNIKHISLLEPILMVELDGAKFPYILHHIIHFLDVRVPVAFWLFFDAVGVFILFWFCGSWFYSVCDIYQNPIFVH